VDFLALYYYIGLLDFAQEGLMIFVQFAMSVSCYFQASRFSGDDSALIHIWVYRRDTRYGDAKYKRNGCSRKGFRNILYLVSLYLTVKLQFPAKKKNPTP
jgi:hypothetical protein